MCGVVRPSRYTQSISCGMDALGVLRVTGGGRRARQVFHKLVFDAVRLLLPSCLAAQRPQAQVLSSFLIPGLCELCARRSNWWVSCFVFRSCFWLVCPTQARGTGCSSGWRVQWWPHAHARQLCAQRKRRHLRTLRGNVSFSSVSVCGVKIGLWRAAAPRIERCPGALL